MYSKVKTKSFVLILTIISLFIISAFVPQINLIFHLDKFEVNDKCELIGGDWDWYHDICDLEGNLAASKQYALQQNITITDVDQLFDLKCSQIDMVHTCADTCLYDEINHPLYMVIPFGCSDMCDFACKP